MELVLFRLNGIKVPTTEPVRHWAFRIRAPWINWRAGRIADPVARLRYLRSATDAEKLPRIPKVALLALGLGTAAALIIPGHTQLLSSAISSPPRPRHAAPAAPADPGADVWLVESKEKQYELYSNGLRIETAHAVKNIPRAWRECELPKYTPGALRKDPVGIVYHTTENHQLPFEAEENAGLLRMGEGLLRYVKQHHSYHYVIDRFGRVHRVVEEGHAAAHAGHSLWADAQLAYINMNHEFLGVGFETATAPGDELPPSINPAQVRSARALTEMLRTRYRIPASNCVTHAQVSVNPKNHRIGNHTDWASNFPFLEVGLPDNYGLALPAMELFGFGYDQDFVKATGNRLWKGLLLTEERVRQAASARGLGVPEYRALAKKHYRDLMAEWSALRESMKEETGQ